MNKIMKENGGKEVKIRGGEGYGGV